MSTESAPIDINLAQAADAARMVVNSKLQLLNLHAVLDDLAGKQNLVRELASQQATLTASIAQLKADEAVAREKHQKAVRFFAEDQRIRRTAQDQELTRLTEDCRLVERDRDRILRECADAESRLARVRAALADASSAVTGS